MVCLVALLFNIYPFRNNTCTLLQLLFNVLDHKLKVSTCGGRGNAHVCEFLFCLRGHRYTMSLFRHTSLMGREGCLYRKSVCTSNAAIQELQGM